MHQKTKSLQQQMPNAYRELIEVRERLESYFHDVVDIEFTIEKGRLFIVNVRPAKRTGRANLRFLLQFLQEGKVSIAELISRIETNDILEFLKSEIVNLSSLTPLGKGLSACIGAATGEIALSINDAIGLASEGRPFIYVREEVNPDEIAFMSKAQGVLTARGGMTSHAALVCRGWGKPCVVGFHQMKLAGDSLSISEGGMVLEKHKWMTIDGASGRIYAGEGKLYNSKWRSIPELVNIVQIIEIAILSGEATVSQIGKLWKLRDFFMHGMPLTVSRTSKRAVNRRDYVSLGTINEQMLSKTKRNLKRLNPIEKDNYSMILMSLVRTLHRLLASRLGIGNHNCYSRPLWDPVDAITYEIPVVGRQLVGLEFFDINKYIPHLVDVASIKCIFEVEVRNGDEWFLDFTNQKGESLVDVSHTILAYDMRVNNARMSHDDFPIFYNAIRQREYYWNFYETNRTSYEEICEFLESWPEGKSIDNRIQCICSKLGLIRGNRLTISGKSLVNRREGR